MYDEEKGIIKIGSDGMYNIVLVMTFARTDVFAAYSGTADVTAGTTIEFDCLKRNIRYKRYLCVLAAILLGALCACTSYEDEDIGTDVGAAEFDANAAQLYKDKNAAAAENGYYYIASPPVHREDNYFVYFFDTSSMKAFALCSKLNCDHTTQDCDAYVSKDRCQGYQLWYYNGRIYMIERTEEKDLLVSYDKNLRDKRTENELSVDGNSVLGSNEMCLRSCIIEDIFYYVISEENSQSLYSVSLKEQKAPHRIKQYNIEHEIAETLSLRPSAGKLCMNMRVSDTVETSNYLCDCYDIATGEISRLFDSTKDAGLIRGEILQWNLNTCVADNSLFFLTVDEGECILNKLDLSTRQCEEIFVLDLAEHNNSSEYVTLENCDGQYIYLCEGLDLLKARKEKVSGNNLYILNTVGQLVDVAHFKMDEQYENGKNGFNLNFDTFCVDSRYIFAIIPNEKAEGFSLNGKWEELYKKYNDESLITHEGHPRVSLAGVIDKKQIGTGAYQWINITPD